MSLIKTKNPNTSPILKIEFGLYWFVFSEWNRYTLNLDWKIKITLNPKWIESSVTLSAGDKKMPAKTREVHLVTEKTRSAYRLQALPGGAGGGTWTRTRKAPVSKTGLSAIPTRPHIQFVFYHLKRRLSIRLFVCGLFLAFRLHFAAICAIL